MSQENVEIARKMADAYSRGDLEATLDLLAPEFEARPSGLFMDMEDLYRGRDGWSKFWHRFYAAWESITINIERIEDHGEEVLVLGNFNGRGHGSGVEVTRQSAWLLTFREGLVARISSFASWDEAIEAADHSE
jgi:ketosteroid isomerase-like protein